MSKACSACFRWSSAQKQRVSARDYVHRWQSSVLLQGAYDARMTFSGHAYDELRRQPACCRRCAHHASTASTEQAPSAGDVVADEVGVEDVDAESAQLLEWPAVCAQVAAFTSTPAAAERVLSSGLPLGASLVRLTCLLGVQACLLCSLHRRPDLSALLWTLQAPLQALLTALCRWLPASRRSTACAAAAGGQRAAAARDRRGAARGAGLWRRARPAPNARRRGRERRAAPVPPARRRGHAGRGRSPAAARRAARCGGAPRADTLRGVKWAYQERSRERVSQMAWAIHSLVPTCVHAGC